MVTVVNDFEASFHASVQYNRNYNTTIMLLHVHYLKYINMITSTEIAEVGHRNIVHFGNGCKSFITMKLCTNKMITSKDSDSTQKGIY